MCKRNKNNHRLDIGLLGSEIPIYQRPRDRDCEYPFESHNLKRKLSQYFITEVFRKCNSIVAPGTNLM